MDRQRFTLVELLVVVAVIAVLAALLLPVLNQAKDSAHTVHCVSNLRQQSVLTLMYCDDYENYFPKIARTDKWLIAEGHEFDANVWQEALGRLYISPDFPTNSLDWGGGRALIFECPTADRWRRRRIADGYTLYKAEDYGVDYGISQKVIPCRWQDNFKATPIRINRLKRPVIMIADTANQHLFRNPNNPTYGVRHGHSMDRSANFAFTDGRVENSRIYGMAPNISNVPWNDE